MFKIGNLVTPDQEAIKKLPHNDITNRFVGGVYKVTKVDDNGVFDINNYGRHWLPQYWKLAVTPETTFKLIKKHAE